MSAADRDSLLARVAELLEARPEVLEAYVFGSVARGDAAAHSDVDVAVFIDRDRAGEAPFGYAAELTSDLMSGLGLNRVDVVVLNAAPPLLYHRVLRDSVRVVTRDAKATTVREARALSRYCDWVPQMAKIDAVLRSPTSPGETRE